MLINNIYELVLLNDKVDNEFDMEAILHHIEYLKKNLPKEDMIKIFNVVFKKYFITSNEDYKNKLYEILLRMIG